LASSVVSSAPEQSKSRAAWSSSPLIASGVQSSAAEIAGRHRFAARIAAPFVQFAVHGRQQVVHAPQVGAFVKVAVGADALAEGYVEIESGHGYQS